MKPEVGVQKYDYPPPSSWLQSAAGALREYRQTKWWQINKRKELIAHALRLVYIADMAPPNYEREYWVHHSKGNK